MAHIIRSRCYQLEVPRGFPPMVCDVRGGALVGAWVEKIDAPVLTWALFCHMPLRPAGTAFQRKIWHTLGQIPFGQVVSYAQLAQMAGVPRAVRAVGQAVGRNPILWRIPCHRVVRADGHIGGFSAGIEFKRLFLQYENIIISPDNEIMFNL